MEIVNREPKPRQACISASFSTPLPASGNDTHPFILKGLPPPKENPECEFAVSWCSEKFCVLALFDPFFITDIVDHFTFCETDPLLFSETL